MRQEARDWATKRRRSRAWVAAWLGGMVALVPGLAAAEDEDPPQTLVTLDPGGLILGNRLGLELERTLGSSATFYVEPKLVVGGYSPAPHSVTDGLWGGELGVGLRFYFAGDAPHGLYLGPQVESAWVHGNVAGQDTSGYRIGGGALVGYTYLFLDLLDVAVGAGVLYRYDHASVGSTLGSTQGFIPIIRLAVGLGF